MSLNGHAACPTGERCFLIMGKLLAPDGQNWFLIHARYIHIFRVQPTHAIPLICKPSRQLADNREIVNCLFVRILRQKTRWSDSFFAILGFTENQATFTTFTHIYQHRSIPPTGVLKISLSTKSYSPLGFDKSGISG